MAPDLLGRLKFFFKFRNMLGHRYWEIEDRRLLEETRVLEQKARELDLYYTSIGLSLSFTNKAR